MGRNNIKTNKTVGLSSVEKTLVKMEQVRKNPSMKSINRRPHRSEMRPKSTLASTNNMYKKMSSGPRNVGQIRKNVNTDFGPGHSIGGVTDASQRTKYKDRYIIKSTKYGSKLMRSSFDKIRK